MQWGMVGPKTAEKLNSPSESCLGCPQKKNFFESTSGADCGPCSTLKYEQYRVDGGIIEPSANARFLGATILLYCLDRQQSFCVFTKVVFG